MSAKPTTVARWAIDSTFTTDGTNVVTPSSGTMDTGYAHGAEPLSGIDNWRDNIAARWQKWLFDGNCLFTNLTAATLGVSGAVAFAAGLTVGTTLAVTGAATVGGTLGVTGTATLGAATITTATCTNVQSDNYKHGTLTETFSVQLGKPLNNTVAWNTNGSGFGIQGAAPMLWSVPFMLPKKKQILEIRARLKCGGGIITCTAYRVSNANGGTSLGTAGTATTGAFETVVVATGLTETVGTGATYQVVFSAGTSTGTSEFVYIEVDYNQIT